MTRSAVDSRVEDTITYRTVHKYDYASALPGPVKIPSIPDNDDQPHVLYLAGAEDNELVPEFRINGRYQGALSLAFAQALAGAADSNGDRDSNSHRHDHSDIDGNRHRDFHDFDLFGRPPRLF